MKNKFLNLLITAVFIPFFIGCTTNKDDVEIVECVPSQIPFTSIESYFGCANTKSGININLNNTFTIIRSQAEFDQLVTKPQGCSVNLDLTNYDLIIGKKTLTSGYQSVSYEYFTSDCKKLVLKVTFVQNETLIAPNVIYHALVPKISNEQSVEVLISLK